LYHAALQPPPQQMDQKGFESRQRFGGNFPEKCCHFIGCMADLRAFYPMFEKVAQILGRIMHSRQNSDKMAHKSA
jgi:hypothetical protein